jgi:hypothetical protein
VTSSYNEGRKFNDKTVNGRGNIINKTIIYNFLYALKFTVVFPHAKSHKAMQHIYKHLHLRIEHQQLE